MSERPSGGAVYGSRSCVPWAVKMNCSIAFVSSDAPFPPTSTWINSMFGKNSKKSSRSPAKHLLLGIPTNIAVGPLGFRTESDTELNDENNPRPSRIVSNEREGEDSNVAVAVRDTESGNQPPGQNTSHAGQEGEPEAPSRVPEQDVRDTALGTPATPSDVAHEAPGAFDSLKTLLGGMSGSNSNRKEYTAVGNKAEVLLLRIASLDALFATLPGDVVEQKRRCEVTCKIEDIEGRLRSLNEELPDHISASGDTLGFLEDLQEAILQYQMEQRTATDHQGFEQDPAETAVLNCLRYAQQAEYRHGDRSGCLKGTRSAILDEIELWTCDFGKPSVYWLNGLAGTGKSTIARTIAERTFADGRLGASFFCSRDFSDRSNLRFIFSTIAVQLARFHPEFRSALVPLVQSESEIAQESLYRQMKTLIVQPLVKSDISTVIVIDALDECKDEEPASAILSVLGQFVADIPKVKFFVTGRPEPRVREGFRLPLLAKATDVFVLHEVESGQVNNDIQLFLKHNFLEISGCRGGLDGWPTKENVDLLCERAAGLFIYAAATVRFISYKNSDPRRQLDHILRSPGSSTREGRTKLKANTTLDSLYASILQQAFGNDDVGGDPRVRSILGAVILAANPLSPSAIAALLGFESEDVFRLLSSVNSLLVLREDINYPVRPFHRSFPDFIVDPARYTNSRFRVCPPDQHAELLIGCLELMNRRLEQNMCQLPDCVTNSEVVDLKERTKEHLDQALQYACISWHKHLVYAAPAHALKINPVLQKFLEEKFLFWLELLSVLGATGEAADALEATSKWLDVQAPSTLDLVRDYLRFVTAFFEVISTSAPHIYHSALPLSPRTSIVFQRYQQCARPLVRVVRGLPTSWDPIAATMFRIHSISDAVWSPCGRRIAISRARKVVVLDGLTLAPLHTFDTPPHHRDEPFALSFSPDSRLLTHFCHGEVTNWDLQTGGLVGTIPPGPSESPPSCLSTAYSTDGKTLGAVCRDPAKTPPFTIATYDLQFRTHVHSHPVSEGRVIAPIWAHGECLRFATVKSGAIIIWEIGFTLPQTLTEVALLSAPDEIAHAKNYLFLPTLSRLAFTAQTTTSIWDARESKFLLNFADRTEAYRMSFPSNGRFFACANRGGDLNVWKETSAGYTLHQRLHFGNGTTPLFSPNGGSIISCTLTIHLWPTEDPITTPPILPAKSKDRTEFVLSLSPDEKLAAVARWRENVVTIFDLGSGNPRLVIDTGIGVLCLRVTGSTVVVAGGGKAATWNLPADNHSLDARADINDAIQTTTFDHPGRTLDLLETDASESTISPTLDRIATVVYPNLAPAELNLYNAFTGKHLTSTPPGAFTAMLYFSQDGCEIWPATPKVCHGWKVVEDSKPGVTELELLRPTVRPSLVFPWQSSRGYEVREDGWVLGNTWKRLLWLPPRWRSHDFNRAWSGRFLGIGHGELPEVVILEFLE